MNIRTMKPLPRQTAQMLFSRGQRIFFGGLLAAIVVGLVLSWHMTLIVLIGVATAFYLLQLSLKVATWIASAFYRQPLVPVVTADDSDLPTYTLLVPMYREANMLPSLMQAIGRLQYPKHLLQVLLLLEEDDMETRAESIALDAPRYGDFQVVLAPKGIVPRGKPKALNLGLATATGMLTTIFDAEDRPDPDQLLKAVARFRASADNVACVQSRLVFWNQTSSKVTRFYWAEYGVWYDFVLGGLTKLKLVPPLGGTSNHFKTQVLRDIAIPHDKLPVGAEGIGGWDPYNVTEDAELAAALAMNGYDIVLMDSVTHEEATAKLKVADGQRRRWLKGYMMSGLVYSRAPIRTARRMGVIRWLCYELTVLGTPVSLLLNPIFWAMTACYLFTGSTTIEHLFPRPLLYAGTLLLFGGNALLFWQLQASCIKREGYGSVKFMFLTPLWWLFSSYSCYRAMFELCRASTRSKWIKTEHGHDLHKEIQLDNVSAVRLETT